jgi:hypothetical protein
MQTQLTSAGAVNYDSRGSGDPVVLPPSGGHERGGYDGIRAGAARFGLATRHGRAMQEQRQEQEKS